jgi:hypothetical protein
METALQLLCGSVCLYVVGMFVAASVMRARAGVGVWHRLKVLGDDGFGVAWVTQLTVATMFWPITLVIWLARGCPEPRVVFNEKAVERQLRSNNM